MKGNVFSGWLKEFCALVFTQTVQAFLLAIILLIVVISISNGDAVNNTHNITAGGVLAIIALTSISKMEDLIKKLFGLNSSITDSSMKGGKGGLLGTVAALSMAKKALNNIPKMGKGVSGSIKARKDRRQAEIDATNKLRKLNARYGVGGESSNSQSTPARVTNTQNNPVVNAAQERLDELVADGFGPGDPEYDRVENELNAARARVTNSESNPTQSAKSSSEKINDKYEDKKEKIMEEYSKKIAEAKKLGKESRKQILSGALETNGAIMGGIAGAVIAAGTGDNVFKSMGTGIGVGDVLGKAAVDTLYVPGQVKDAISDYRKTAKKYKKEENERMIKEFKDEFDRFNAGDID